MLKRIEHRMQDVLDRALEALGYHRHPPPVRLTRIVIVRVPDEGGSTTRSFTLSPAHIRVTRVQPRGLLMAPKA